MPDYLVICRDRAGSDTARRSHLRAHLAYVEQIIERIRVAGPLVEESDGGYRSSCFVYRAQNQAEALALLHADPYFRAGVYTRTEIHEFRAVAGTWVGGCAWKDTVDGGREKEGTHR